MDKELEVLKTEVVESAKTGAQVPAPAPTAQEAFFYTLQSLAANPDVDVAKIKQLMEMQEHVLDREAEKAFNAAMVMAQRNMPIVPKDKTNSSTSSPYSSYEMILKHTQPVYTEEGFSLSFYEGDTSKDGHIRIMVDVMHKDGHTKQRFVDIPLDNVGIKGSVNKTNTHAKGSSISYGRSYLIKMVFNIPTGDDDDGNGAGTECITEEQRDSIMTIITDNNLTEDPKYLPRLYKYLKVKTLAEVTDYQNALAAVNKGVKGKKGKK